MRQYDAIILGAGCSGLSLAMSVATSSLMAPRFAIIEARGRYEDDRTWCFWDVQPHPHQDLVSRRWNRWQVKREGQRIDCQSEQFAYCQIRSGDFYRKGLKVLSSSPTMDFLPGRMVTQVRRCDERWEIAAGNQWFSAPLVFDSRPPRIAAGPQTTWQHFAGWRVRAGHEWIDPKTAVLMDFGVSQKRGLHFFYLLPETSRTALVEATFIGSSPFERHHYEEALRSYLDEKLGGETFEILDEEHGCIPMNSDLGRGGADSPRDGWIALGTTGGCIKSSSGYGFLAIQRQVARLVEQWEAGSIPAPICPRAPAIRWLDNIFLRWLQKHPDSAPQLFANLFERVPTDRLVRFLSDVPLLADVLSVMLAMPRAEFAREAIDALLERDRNGDSITHGGRVNFSNLSQ